MKISVWPGIENVGGNGWCWLDGRMIGLFRRGIHSAARFEVSMFFIRGRFTSQEGKSFFTVMPAHVAMFLEMALLK